MSYRDENFKDIRTLRKAFTLEKTPPRPRPSLHIETEILGHSRSKSTEKWGTPSHTRIRDSTAYSPLAIVAKSRPELETTIPSMRGLLQRDLSSAKLRKRRDESPLERDRSKTPKSRAEIHEEIRNKIQSMSHLRLKKDKEEEIEFDIEELKGPLIDTQGTLGEEINHEENKVNRNRQESQDEHNREVQEPTETSIIEYLRAREESAHKRSDADQSAEKEEEKQKIENEKAKPIETISETREKRHKESDHKPEVQKVDIPRSEAQRQEQGDQIPTNESKEIKEVGEAEPIQFTFREEKKLKQELKEEDKSSQEERLEIRAATPNGAENNPEEEQEIDRHTSDEDSKIESREGLDQESESQSANSIEESGSESDSEEIAKFEENESLARGENEIELGGNRLFNTENSEESKGQGESDKQGIETRGKSLKEGGQEGESATIKKVKKGKKKKKTKKVGEKDEKTSKDGKTKKSSSKKKDRSKSQEKEPKKLVKKVSLVKISPSKASDPEKTKRKASPKRVSVKLQPVSRKSLTNRSATEIESPKKRKSVLNQSREKSLDRSRSSNSSSPGKVVKVKSILKKSKTILTEAQESIKKEQEIKILDNFESPKNAQGIIEQQKKKDLRKSKTQEGTLSVDLTQYSSSNQAEQLKEKRKSETKTEVVTLNLNEKQTSSKSKEAMSPTKADKRKEISISVAEDKANKLIKNPSQKKIVPANQETEKNPAEKEQIKQTDDVKIKGQEDKINKMIKSPSQKKMTPANQEVEKNIVEKESSKQTDEAKIKDTEDKANKLIKSPSQKKNNSCKPGDRKKSC